jgi:hypothetical protein
VVPAVVFAVLAYALTVVGLAAAFRHDRDTALVGATLLILQGARTGLQTAASGTLWLLQAAEQRLQDWIAKQSKQTTAPGYIHAA